MRMNRRNTSASSCGKPSILTMTRSGMCWEYSTAASISSRPATASSSSLQSCRVNGSSAAMGLGANAGSNSRRARAWKGGSDVIGGARPIGAGGSSGPGRTSLTTTERELKCSGS